MVIVCIIQNGQHPSLPFAHVTFSFRYILTLLSIQFGCHCCTTPPSHQLVVVLCRCVSQFQGYHIIWLQDSLPRFTAHSVYRHDTLQYGMMSRYSCTVFNEETCTVFGYRLHSVMIGRPYIRMGADVMVVDCLLFVGSSAIYRQLSLFSAAHLG